MTQTERPEAKNQAGGPGGRADGRNGGRGARPLLVLAAIVVLGVAGYAAWRVAHRGLVETDDAAVEADVVPIAARVSGEVLRVAVRDNQAVKRGDLLVEIDPLEHRARLEQAEAELGVARADERAAEADLAIVSATSQGGLSSARALVSSSALSVQVSQSQVSAAEASVARAEVDLRTKTQDLDRARSLADQGVIARATLDNAEAAEDAAQARLVEAQAQLRAARELAGAARARVSEAQGRLEQSEPVEAQQQKAAARLELARSRARGAKAAVDLARLALERTRVVAPEAGTVSRFAARQGQVVQPGQLLVNLVLASTYVVANFKETQIGLMRPGQRAEIEVDTYPGRTFAGRVESLSPGTGARFSLLPSDNATGNFVRVVQRVPVRIAWEGGPPPVRLEPGLSAIVTVRVR